MDSNDKIDFFGTTIKHESAGGFVFYQSPNGNISVALLKKAGAGYFIPKGHLKGNETPEQSATREIIEELSLKTPLKLITKVGTNKYSFLLPNESRPQQKLVHLFIFKVNHKAHLHCEKDGSYEKAEWVPVEKAYGLLTHGKDFLQKAVRILQQAENCNLG